MSYQDRLDIDRILDWINRNKQQIEENMNLTERININLSNLTDTVTSNIETITQINSDLNNVTKEVTNLPLWIDKTEELNEGLQQYCTFEVNPSLRLAQLTYQRSDLRLDVGTTISNVDIPLEYLTTHRIHESISSNIYYTLFNVGSVNEGKIAFGNGSGSATTPEMNFQLLWHY